MDENFEHRATIGRNVIFEYFQVYRNDLFTLLCKNILKNKLIENGIKLVRNSVPIDIPSKYIWLQFAVDLLDMVMVLGICPVRFDRKQNMPYVPPAGTFEIRILTLKDGTRKFQMYDEEHLHDPVPDCLIITGLGYDPDINGNLTSVVHTLRPTILFIAAIQDCAIEAETLRANPPIVTERKELNDEKREGVNFDFFADSDSTRHQASSVYRRDANAIDQLKRQKQMFQDALSGRTTSTAEAAMDNVLPLPTGYTHATTIQATARTDFVSMQRLYQETICAVIGVPRSMVITDSNVKSDLVGAHQIFRLSLLWWRKTLERGMTRSYRMLFLNSEAKNMARIAKRRRLGNFADDYVDNSQANGNKSIKKGSIQQIVEDNLPSITMPVAPYLEIDDLKELYHQEIINWETYCKYMLRTCSLPQEDLNSTSDPWTHEDRKNMLGFSGKGEARTSFNGTHYPARKPGDAKKKTISTKAASKTPT